MVSNDRHRPLPHRRHRGIAGRRWCAGSEVVNTPFLAWKYRGGDSVGGAAAAISARKLAASLWHFAAAANGAGSVRRQCGFSFDRLGFEFCSSAPIPKFSMEGVTKWDFCHLKAWGDATQFQSNTAFTRQLGDPYKSRKSADKNEAGGGLSRTKKEEMASCLRIEGQKTCSEIKNLADGVNREMERKNSDKMGLINSILLRDIAESKSSAKRLVQNLEKEKKVREDLEGLCQNLAKEIEGHKAQIGALMNQQKRIEMKVEEERKLLQISELWREEQVQMKIADARMVLEDKYAEIGNLVADLKAYIKRLNLVGDVDETSKAKALMQSFDSVNIQRVKSFNSRLPKSSKGVAIINNSQSGEVKRSDHDGARSGSHKSEGSVISSASLMQSKRKCSSAGKIQTGWCRSKDACKNITVDGSSDRSSLTRVSPKGVLGERQVKVERNPHVVRAMKGHIEWPRGIPRRNSAANLLKAKFDSQKTLLRNVLKRRS